MKKLLIATHGSFAQGIYHAASIIAGEKEWITCINAYTECKNIQEAFDAYFAEVKEEDQILVLTDLFGGSVNQAVMPYIAKGNVNVITGMNLALLLEVCMSDPQKKLSEDELRSLVNGARQQLQYVNDVLQTSQIDDFD